MRRTIKRVPIAKKTRDRWRRWIIREKGCTETTAEWMAQRIWKLLDYMQYGHALLAYHKQDGTFQLIEATLIHYEKKFQCPYRPDKVVGGTVVYWSVEQQGWRSFQLENFLDWKPIV